MTARRKGAAYVKQRTYEIGLNMFDVLRGTKDEPTRFVNFQKAMLEMAELWGRAGCEDGFARAIAFMSATATAKARAREVKEFDRLSDLVISANFDKLD